MTEKVRQHDESRLIEALIEYDRKIVAGQDSNEGFADSEISSNQHRTILDKARQCLEKLQQFAQRKEFPVVPAGLLNTPVDVPRDGSTVEQIVSTEYSHADQNTPVIEGKEHVGEEKTDHLPQKIGRFKIVRQLGVGGFGIVFLALDPKLNREVAIKILRPESLMTSANRLRFERESQLAALLNHPAIVPVYETGTDGPIRYIVFGYLPGENLSQWFARWSRCVDSKNAVRMMIRVTDAISYAHGRGVLHRDLKPANLLVHSDDLDVHLPPEKIADRIHVADFGLAINLEHSSTLTRSGAMVGTPVYIAPELISGDDRPSAASDVYSLGVVLYELLAGRPPFQADSGLQLMRAIMEDEPPRINTILETELRPGSAETRRGVSKDLESICFKCLQKNPAERYQTAREFHLDLQNWHQGRPVTARPVSAWARGVRWASRKPLLASLLGTVTLLVVTLAIGGTWGAFELTNRNVELQDSYFQSLMSQSQMARQTTKAGRRTELMSAVSAAAELLPGVDNEERFRLQLRNQAIAGMDMMDILVRTEIPVPKSLSASSFGHEIAFDSTLGQVAYPDVEGNVVIVDTQSGRTRHLIRVDDGEIRHLLFAPNSDRLCAVIQRKNTTKLIVWNFENGSRSTEWEIAGLSPSFRIDCSDDGTFAAFLDSEQKLRLLNLKTGGIEIAVNKFDHGPPQGATFSPPGAQIAVWSGNRVEVWDLDSIEPAIQPIKQFEYLFNPMLEITAAAWSPNGEQLATSSSVFTTHLWSMEWGESKHQELAGHTHWTYHTNYDPDGKFITTSSSDSTTRFWDSGTSDLLLHEDGRVFAISADGTRLAGIRPEHIVVWEILGAECQYGWFGGEADCVRPLAADLGGSNNKGNLLAYVNAFQVAIRDTSSLEYLWQKEWNGASGVTFSGDGTKLFTCDAGNIFQVDVEAFAEAAVSDERNPDNRAIYKGGTLAASFDGSLLFVDTCDGPSLIKTQTGQQFETAFQLQDGSSIVFHPDQPLFAANAADGIAIWNYESDEIVDLIAGIEFSNPVGFAVGGSFLLLHHNNRPALLNLEDRKLTQLSEKPIQLDGDDIAVSHDNRWLAVCGIDDAIVLYEVVRGPASKVIEVARFPIGISSTWVAFSASADKLIFADHNHRVFHWSLPEVRQRMSELGLDWKQ